VTASLRTRHPAKARGVGQAHGISAERQGRLIDRIRALGVANAVLHLGGHPDDEEGGMIAFMSRRHAARTVYWSATRGEGGQNRRGTERGEALGVLRTWESLEARAIDGGEVLYGPFYDFGFSKSGEDTLRRWGRESVIREMVRAIRLVQPLVVVSRWSGGASDGHGHHQAIGLAARAAYDAAGDPTRFRELGLPAWQPQKLYRSVAGDWQPGEDGTFGVIVDEYEQAGYVRIDTGAVDPVAGLTYQEQAHLAINRHRTQGMGFVPEPGSYYFYYRLEHCQRPVVGRESGMFDGLDASLVGLADYPGSDVPHVRDQLESVLAHVDAAFASFRSERPGVCVPHLLAALAALRDLADALAAEDALTAYVDRRIAEIEVVIAACRYVRVECLSNAARVTPGQRVDVSVRVWNGGTEHISVLDVDIRVPTGWTVTPASASGDAEVALESPHIADFRLELPELEPPTTPYWLRAERGPFYYAWPDGHPSLGMALDRPLVAAVVAVLIDDQVIRLQAPAVRRDGFVGGSRELPLSVLPPLAVVPRQRREIIPVSTADQTLELDVTVRCVEDMGASATLSLTAPATWTVEPREVRLAFAAGGETRNVRFRVVVPADADPAGYELLYDLDSDGRPCGVELNPVRLGVLGSSGTAEESNCVSEAFLVQPAKVAVHLVDATFVTTLNYAYVCGVDEQILSSVDRFGLNITELTDAQLEFADLAAFAAIIVGPKAYNARPAVRRNAARLLEYARDGGTLVVQYQTYGYDDAALLPWPATFHQPHDRVTDATGPVEILDPTHSLMRFPNELGARDFEGWVHDRGLYFLGEWDRRYVPLLSSSDVGEPPREGGLLSASVGSGAFVYVAYSLFRQIPAGVPGAIRLFANLLGLAEVRVRERAERLARVELFAYMTEAQLYQAARIVSERWVDAGTYLARQGEQGREMFILLDGEIEVIKESEGKQDRLLHTARAGESLGELTLLADMRRSATLRAGTDAVVLIIQNDAFQEWLDQHPDLGRRLLAQLAMKIVAKDQL
jgi:LmbE family N-acetylglucosaminyl deacetylase